MNEYCTPRNHVCGGEPTCRKPPAEKEASGPQLTQEDFRRLLREADERTAIIAEDNARLLDSVKEALERERMLQGANDRLRAQVTDLEARVAALLAGEQTPPPAIDPTNPLDEPEGKQVTDTLAADTQLQESPAEAPKRGRPPKSTPVDTPKD